MSAVTTKREGRNVVWSFREGATVHLCEGATIHPGIFLLWTRCRKHDVPAGSGWLKRQHDVITCEACCLIEATENGKG